ncbi:MAG: Pr6Pr family membrane protein [Ignavibacteria bacterium]|nr:Pr6Pr family membrane protein [Ignavibacteria bacterium]
MKKTFQIMGAVAAWFAGLLQFYISMKFADSRAAEAIRFFSFMTIWTNIIIAVYYTVLILSPQTKLGRFFSRPMVQAGLLLYIIIVGLIYHLILANQWNPQGLEFIADQSLHTVVPILYLFYWIFFSEKEKLSYSSALKWLEYPVIYIVYSLIRGAITGKYPYFFVDVTKLGYATTLTNASYVLAAYFVLGLMLVFINNLMTNKEAIDRRVEIEM